MRQRLAFRLGGVASGRNRQHGAHGGYPVKVAFVVGTSLLALAASVSTAAATPTYFSGNSPSPYGRDVGPDGSIQTYTVLTTGLYNIQSYRGAGRWRYRVWRAGQR